MTRVEVELSSAPTLNFAMEQSGVPVVTGVRVRNVGEKTLDGAELTVSIRPDIAAESIHRIARLHPGESIELGALDLRLEPGRLRTLREAERGELAWKLCSGGSALATGTSSIDVLAHNEWAGLRAPPPLLATFVTPNAPSVGEMLVRVRDRLRETTGDAGLSGYQSRSPSRVRETVVALYDVIPALGITYVGVPASFEEVGQKVRLADRVVADKMGNCLDVTVLVASCLEQMGLAPLLLIQKGHAIPGVWLVEDRFHEGVVYDAARIRNAIALGNLLFFDSSASVSDPPVPFALAEQTAHTIVADDAKFICVIDVPVARRDRYRPLPLRDEDVQKSVSPASSLGEAARREAARSAGAPDGSAPAQPPPSATASPVDQRLKQYRDRLLDLSLRNKLLNFRSDSKGALVLDVPNVPRFEDLLSSPGAEFEVLPRPDKDSRDRRDSRLVQSKADEGARRADMSGDLDRRVLHCPYDEVRMAKHAVHLQREARTALEEGGANVLYAAIGFLKWFETDTSPTERLAPLLLVPVAAEYARATKRLRIRRLPDDALPNQTLIEKIARDFGIELTGLANLQADEAGIDVPLMLRSVREAIQKVNRWEVLEEVHLGLFQFQKFLMWKDLEENKDALLANEVVRHIASGSLDSFPSRGPQIPVERMDDAVPVRDLPLVVDADSTQTAAIHSALNGQSFVLQGPPGTGKSQTITNLIGAAIARGKTVLFVSEKMAALEVVHRRLEASGLGDFCLELHSHKATKKSVVESLGRTLERGQKIKQPDWAGRSDALESMRASLNGYVRALHAPQPLGMTFHQASARLIALSEAPPLDIRLANPTGLTRESLARSVDLARAFASMASSVEPVAAHPFRHSAIESWTAQHDAEVRRLLSGAIRACEALESARGQLLRLVGWTASEPPSLTELGLLADACVAVSASALPGIWRQEAEWSSLREGLHRWTGLAADRAQRRTTLALRWNDDLLARDVESHHALFARWAHAFFLFAWFFLRGARRELAMVARGALPPSPQIAQDLANVRTVREVESKEATELRALKRSFDRCWTDESGDTLRDLLVRGDALRATARRIERLVGASPRGESLRHALERVLECASVETDAAERRAMGEHSQRFVASVESFRAHAGEVKTALAWSAEAWPADGPLEVADTATLLRSLEAQVGAFRGWCFYRKACADLTAAQLGAVIEAHRAGALRANEADRAVERAILTAWTTATRDANDILREFDGKRHHELVERFQKHDREHAGLARAHIAMVLESRVPRAGDAAATSEPGILKRELAKKRGHKPLRKLLTEIPSLLVRLKPCLLMSPLSVAQYLPATGRRFDIVVFDEASQIGPHDGIGAMARGEQVVIVGDSKQLPPTAFFQKGGADDDAPPDENAIEDVESILDQALAAGLPEQMLGWHYRSRHEALIEFSNERYYQRRLHVFPAARGRVDDLGVKFHHVSEGVYDTGNTRQNALEAKALVSELVRAMKRFTPEERTFGVVTFSATQMELVEELLGQAVQGDPQLERHMGEGHPRNERVFVKNLENVQGDERDEIFFSVGYGPDVQGKMAMNFGPLNREGGERRLNVAVTRARMQLRVFASFTHDKIDLNRTRAVGSAHLKAFLRFAQERTVGAVARGDEPSGDFDSDFERDVFDALRAMGHKVDTQVGCGAYRIDLAVPHPEHPGVYALGIECDGAAYHSGATARDRDRLRQGVLEGLGWRLHRIWSTDWIYERERELQRLEAALEDAIRNPVKESAPKIPEASLPSVEEVAEPPQERAADTQVRARAGVVVYQRAPLEPNGMSPEEIHEARHLGTLSNIVLRVVSAEAPIHVDELARRVSFVVGGAKVTERFRKRVLQGLVQVRGFDLIGDVVWDQSVDRAMYRDVRVPAPGQPVRDLDVVPVEELAAAARIVLEDSLSLMSTDLVREVARMFGVQRVGAKVESRLREAVAHLASTGACRVRGDQVEMVS